MPAKPLKTPALAALLVCFTCVSPLLTQVTWGLSSEALGMEWRRPLPESERSESVLMLSWWPGLSWGWGEAGERERGAQTKTKGCLALAQQFADSEEQSVSQVRRQRRSLCVLV